LTLLNLKNVGWVGNVGGGGVSLPVGGWKELARTTLGSPADDITVSSLANKRYLMVLHSCLDTGGDIGVKTEYNADTGANYATRFSENGLADITTEVNKNADLLSSTGKSSPFFAVTYFVNLATAEKLRITDNVYRDTAGAGNAPIRGENVGKWANTTDAINSIKSIQAAAGSYDTNSEVVVLGWDPADTHTDNFWAELASVDLSGGDASFIDSGTITTKKYLWIQLFTQQTVDSDYFLTFNADSNPSYARRISNNGGADSTAVSQTKFAITSTGVNVPAFANLFVVNRTSNEKLIIAHEIHQGTAGAGNFPTRWEAVGKWANTIALISSMRVTSGSGNLDSKTILKIWGSN